MVGRRGVMAASLVGALASVSLVGCDGEQTSGAQRQGAPEELTEMLEDVIRFCGKQGEAEACWKAQNMPPGASVKKFKFPGGLLTLTVLESCRSKNFAELEAVVVLASGTTHVRAGFVRYENGGWFIRRIVTVDGSTPALCEDIPNVHTANEARGALADPGDWARWSREDGRDVVDFGVLLNYGCGVEEVVVAQSPDAEPMRFDVKCSYTDGFPASAKSVPPGFRLAEGASLYVKLVFTDGTTTSTEKFESTGRDKRASPDGGSRPAKSSGSRLNRALVGADGGEVLLDGVVQCEAPCEIRVPVGDGVSHEIRLRKEGQAEQVVMWRPKSVAEPFPSF